MMPPKDSSIRLLLAGLSLGLFVTCWPGSAYANVYATNIKINGSLTSASAAPGASVSISYILNEPASGGVTVKILSGATAVRTLAFASGASGTARGTNTVTWDGKDAGNQNLPPGSYSVSITAASTGYPVWTQTTTDYVPPATAGDPGTYLYGGHGIAVDRNANSPYYGRVFAANGPAGGYGLPGDQTGIIKCNADGSFADEGGFSTGGHTWAGNQYSPWKVEVSADDHVYVNDYADASDWAPNGDVYRWDPTLSTGSQLRVLDSTNWASANGDYVSLSGPAIWGTGTNTEIWMADDRFVPTGTNFGIIRYYVSADGTCSNGDTGTTVVGVGGSLDLYPVDVAIGPNHAIYTLQYVSDTDNPSQRVMCFPAYDPSTNGGAPEYAATWAVGGGDPVGDWCNGYGIAVDPTGTYVLVAFEGAGIEGCTKVLSAATGAVVTNLDLGRTISGYNIHNDTDCAWDAVGNAYYIDNYVGAWRAVSPPGTNFSTTGAVAALQITGGAQAPYITSIAVAGTIVTINFTGAATDPSSAFTLLSSATPNGTYSAAGGAVITGSGGNYQATVSTSGTKQFYRIKR
jgi:hypothetical protein